MLCHTSARIAALYVGEAPRSPRNDSYPSPMWPRLGPTFGAADSSRRRPPSTTPPTTMAMATMVGSKIQKSIPRGTTPSPTATDYAAKKRPPSARAIRDAVMIPILVAIWAANYRVYGAHKRWKAACRADHDIGRDQVARLMRAGGITGSTR